MRDSRLVGCEAVFDSLEVLVFANGIPSILDAWYGAFVNGTCVSEAKLQQHLPIECLIFQSLWFHSLENLRPQPLHLLEKLRP